ncbi:hydroxyethylthiazole kinase [Atlantibacter hermannii]|uniref:hydroxyethylthiazole kinase n=1 Tax=Atlantibacter hermannii TaxID=565 RepID=UPI0022B7AF02|nr:hydroxyethylthiazole kinase [Atlantibacter hermannii]MCZ7836376.1 hydroxyethylthiazole kinase [Atlantibacter hermannii]
MQPDLLSPAQTAHIASQLATRSPLVHCLTNQVVQSFTANVLLAVGASPAMVVDHEEALAFSAIADALLINIGTLTREQALAMRAAIDGANRAGKPWTLDPVAVGPLAFRSRFAREVITQNPAAIRGNASEILALAGNGAGGRGVDTTQGAQEALSAARELARQTGAIVAVTGEVDYVTDGEHTLAIIGGDPLMTRVVGTGCALSAVVAAACALPGSRLENVAAACGIFAQAGKRAAAQCQGPGSFPSLFLDALFSLHTEGAR